MGQVSIPWASFNCGELSPLLDGRTEMPQYMKGGKTMLNFLPTAQGPAVRRGGTRYLDNQASPFLLMRFSRSVTESYVLMFRDGKLRFYYDGGVVEDAPGHIYEIDTPYTQDELFNADGTPMLVGAESADVVYLAHPHHPPQVLTFFGPTNWTLGPLNYVDGPWQDGNANPALTVYVTGATAVGSSVVITASGPLFNASMVGSLMRIHQKDLTTLKPWQPGQQTPNIAVGVLRRSGFCTYAVANCSPGIAPVGGSSLLFVQTGGVTLVHTEGNAWDGDQSTTIDPIGSSTYFSTGVEWTYKDCGYGVVRITGFSDTQHVVGTVERALPAAVIGPSNVTDKWELGAWSNDQGWPAQVTFFNQRLTFAGGAGNRNRVWMSVVQDYANFADLYFGQVLEDSAVTVTCQSAQVNAITYLSPASTLMVGTTGGEFIVGPQSISDPFGPLNATVDQQSDYGGRNVPPQRVNQYTLFVTRNGRRLRESTFAFNAGPSGSYVSNDLTVLSEHITNGGIVATAWAQNPYTAIWMALGNGNLISFIYNPEQEVKNWERHDVAAQGRVRTLCVIPSIAGDWDEVYLGVERTNDYFGSSLVQYTLERLEQPFLNLPGQAQQDCFYVDCGLTLANTIDATLLPGPGYLIVGTTGVAFSAGSGVFAATDVGRYIHYDWQTTQVADDGLTVPLATRGIALITAVLSSTIVEATILGQWPNLHSVPIAANAWRMTVTKILASSVPTAWQGRTLSFLADGACQADQVYPEGGGTDIELAYPASVIQAGLRSPAVFQSMRLEGGDSSGTAQGKLKRIIRATVRVLNTLGLRLGRDIVNSEVIDQRQPTVADDNPPPLMTGDYPNDDTGSRLAFLGDWDRKGRIFVMQEQPLPMTLVSTAVLVDVEEDS